ncbi:putative DD34D transposase [Trichonephila clavipes]|nr:putative DD34D transposase [Trichonephila clavipes]
MEYRLSEYSPTERKVDDREGQCNVWYNGIFDVKDAPRTSRLVVENVDKITEIIEVDRHVPHKLTPKSTMDRISICEVFVKRNEIDPFLKRMVAGDEKWVTCDNIMRKRSWSKRSEAAQTVAKSGLMARKVLLCI